jgi:hypothetical protein
VRGGGDFGRAQPCRLAKLESSFSIGQAEGAFPVELGSARVRKPGYQTTEIVKFSVGMGNAGLARATKHALKFMCMHAWLFYLFPQTTFSCRLTILGKSP